MPFGQRDYQFLKSGNWSYVVEICGRNAFQVLPGKEVEIDFHLTAARLQKVGEVNYNHHLLRFSSRNIEISLFRDGRAIIKNAVDKNSAKSIYGEYIGF